jgi:hypothetical protein
MSTTRDRLEQEYTAELRDALNFTPDDVDANRRGSLTDAQQAQLEKMSKRAQGLPEGCHRAIMLVLLVVLLAGGALVYVIAGKSLLATFSGNPLVPAVVGFAILSGIVAAMFSGRNMKRIRESVNSLDKMPLQAVEGRVTVRSGDYSSGTITFPLVTKPVSFFETGRRRGQLQVVTIDDQRLVMNPEFANGFTDGGAYRLYYVKFASYVLTMSAELVDLPLA